MTTPVKTRERSPRVRLPSPVRVLLAFLTAWQSLASLPANADGIALMSQGKYLNADIDSCTAEPLFSADEPNGPERNKGLAYDSQRRRFVSADILGRGWWTFSLGSEASFLPEPLILRASDLVYLPTQDAIVYVRGSELLLRDAADLSREIAYQSGSSTAAVAFDSLRNRLIAVDVALRGLEVWELNQGDLTRAALLGTIEDFGPEHSIMYDSSADRYIAMGGIFAGGIWTIDPVSFEAVRLSDCNILDLNPSINVFSGGWVRGLTAFSEEPPTPSAVTPVPVPISFTLAGGLTLALLSYRLRRRLVSLRIL